MRRALKLITFVMLIGAIGLAAFLWWDQTRDVTLREPSGPYAVGRSIADWRDAKHELLVWIWHPASAAGGYARTTFRRPCAVPAPDYSVF